jgi:hypothetical protein
MNVILFFQRRFDELTNWLHVYRKSQFKQPPKKKHDALTVVQMRKRLIDGLYPVMVQNDFNFNQEGPDQITWTRLHPSIGEDRFTIQLLTKHAPTMLAVDLTVGFTVPAIQDAMALVYEKEFETNRAAFDVPFAGSLLRRVYDNPLRPKQRVLFPESFEFWSVDFRESEIKKISETISRYAIPYFYRFKTIHDLKGVRKPAAHQAALLSWLGETELALQFLNDELRKTKLYGPEMVARLECLKRSIEDGHLQDHNR